MWCKIYEVSRPGQNSFHEMTQPRRKDLTIILTPWPSHLIKTVSSWPRYLVNTVLSYPKYPVNISVDHPFGYIIIISFHLKEISISVFKKYPLLMEKKHFWGQFLLTENIFHSFTGLQSRITIQYIHYGEQEEQ